MKVSRLTTILCRILAASIFLVSAGRAAAAPPATSQAATEPASRPSGKIVATVNGEPIYESELMALMPDDAFAAMLEDLKQSKLRRLVQEAVQSQFLAERKVVVSEEEMAKGLIEFEKMVKTPGCPCCGGGYEDLAQFMKVNAFSMSEVRRRVACDLGLKLYTERLTKERIGPEALAETLKKNRTKIEAEYVNGYVISFISVRDPRYFGNEKAIDAEKAKLADDALARLKKGDAFEKVAKEMSEDVDSAPNGGALGCVRADVIGRDVEQAFHKVEPGAYSGVVKATWGCGIVMRKKLTEEDIQSVVKDQAKDSAEEQVYQEFKTARDRAKIQYAPPPASAPAP